MKVAYFTPLNPEKSGVSDWAEELLPELQKYFDIELFVCVDFFDKSEISNISIKKSFTIHNIDDYDDESLRRTFDISIFQAGNNCHGHEKIMKAFMKYGGVLELHDVAMHHYLADTTIARGRKDNYLKILQYCHGAGAVVEAENAFSGYRNPLWEEESLKYCVTKHFIDRSSAVVVHSDYAKQIVKGIAPEKNVYMIPLHCPEVCESVELLRKEARKDLNIEYDQVVFASFGFAGKEKRILQILTQLRNLKRFTRRNFKYYIVGKNNIAQLEEMIKEFDLSENVMVLGAVTLDVLKKYMMASDLCFNLRYPTQGESSASLLRLLGYGKSVVVTDIGSFSEFSEKYVHKVRHDSNEGTDILRVLLKYMKNENRKKPEDIISYVKNSFSLQVIGKKYYDALSSNENVGASYVDGLLDRIMSFHPYEKSIFEKISE